MKAVQVYYEGRVQGVGFRWTVKNLAKEFDVFGTVRNLPDGRVELQAAGERGELDAFLKAVRESTLAGHIAGELVYDLPKPPAVKGFQIIA
jgi:acylphosphatase